MIKKVKSIQETIGPMILDYFDSIGELIIDARDNQKELTFSDINPLDVQNARDLGILCNNLCGNFASGKSSEISTKLFSKDSMTYHEYMEGIYQLLCENFEGGWEYKPGLVYRKFQCDNQRHAVIVVAAG